MTQLRAIGSYIESSGIDLCWMEAGLYGSETVKQIIDGIHVRRGERAHVITLQALFTLYHDAVLQQHPQARQSLEKAAETLYQACVKLDRSKIEETAQLASTIDSLKVVEEISRFQLMPDTPTSVMKQIESIGQLVKT